VLGQRAWKLCLIVRPNVKTACNNVRLAFRVAHGKTKSDVKVQHNSWADLELKVVSWLHDSGATQELPNHAGFTRLQPKRGASVPSMTSDSKS
jgi:hypothetical protein